MYSKDMLDAYGYKEVPDIYLCDENGNILYFTDVTKTMVLSQMGNKNWRGYFSAAIGNLENWFKISADSNIKTIYFRTYKRSKDTGEDIPYGILINEPNFHSFHLMFRPDADPFDFMIKFDFKMDNLRIVEGDDCPEVIKTWNEHGELNISYIKPKRIFSDIKKEEVIKKIQELKDKRRGIYEVK